MAELTPISALAGGALIGLAASLLLLLSGRRAGISGILAGLAAADGEERAWRGRFVVGLLMGGLVMVLLQPAAFGAPTLSLPWVVFAGLLVGFGARLAGGCTSGHGVMGLSGLSRASLIATTTFILAGAFTVFLVRTLHTGGL